MPGWRAAARPTAEVRAFHGALSISPNFPFSVYGPVGPRNYQTSLRPSCWFARCVRTRDLTERRGTQRSAGSAESGRIREMKRLETELQPEPLLNRKLLIRPDVR